MTDEELWAPFEWTDDELDTMIHCWRGGDETVERDKENKGWEWYIKRAKQELNNWGHREILTLIIKARARQRYEQATGDECRPQQLLADAAPAMLAALESHGESSVWDNGPDLLDALGRHLAAGETPWLADYVRRKATAEREAIRKAKGKQDE